MSIHHTIYTIFVFLFVIVLIYAALYFLNRFARGYDFRTKTTRRLKIIERVGLDSKRQLLIIKCDETEHLIMLGAQDEKIIDKLNT